MARKKQSLLNSAMVLVAAMLVVKVIGIIYKIPITNDMGPIGLGYFDAAYNVYIPIYSIALAGLPVAISKMVSHYMTLGRYRDVRKLKRVASRLFFITGTIGTLILIAIAYPYTTANWRFSVHTPELLPSILMIAPSILFCCMMSAYRGYYNGLRNMYPSAISEIVEAVGKAVFGILLVKIVIKKGLGDFNKGLDVFGHTAATEQEAFTYIYPYAAAVAILGVTIGTFLAYLFLVIRHRFIGDGIDYSELRAAPRPDSVKDIAEKLIVIAIPIVTSTLIFNLTNFIDSWTVMNRLATVVGENTSYIREMFAEAFSMYDVENDKINIYLYGTYAISLNFKNLLPTLTVTLGTSAIPVLSEAWTLKDNTAIKRSIESVIRVTMLIALPMGIGMAVMSKQIISILFDSEKVMSGLMISAPCLAAFGFSAFLIASAQPMASVLQGLGYSKIPIVSSTVGASLKIVLNFVLIGIPSINIYGAVVGSVVCYTAMVLINYISIQKITKTKFNLYQIFLKPLFSAVACGIAAYVSYNLLAIKIDSMLVCTGIAVMLAGFVYIVALFSTQAITKGDIKMLPKGENISKLLEKYKILR